MSEIDGLIDVVGTARELPVLALGGCLIHFDKTAPPLRAVLERAADGQRNEGEETLLFRAIHVLGAGRDPLSFPGLVRLLRRPPEELDYLLGDAITETLPRIVAGVFDGNAEALLDLVADRQLDGFIRMGLLGAATFLTWEGRIEKDRTLRFLERFDDERLADPEDPVWVAWQDAIGLLGLDALLPRVERAWQDGRLDELIVDRDDCAQRLAQARREPGAIGRFHDANLGYIDDIAGALEWFGSDDETGDDLADETFLASNEPHVDPWRHVGRNDPCPCGSGKKAKKCCLRT